MLPNEARVDLVPPEGISMVEVVTVPNELDPVVFNVAIKVTGEEGTEDVTVAFPEEVRLTERLVRSLQQVLTARGLKIKRWTLNESQLNELESLSNVMVENKTDPEAERSGD